MKKQIFKLYEKRQLPILVVVIGVLAAVIMWSYWITPNWSVVRANFLSVEEAASRQSARDEEMNALKKFKIYLENEKDKVALINDVLPKAENFDDMLIQIERMAVDNNIFIKSVNVLDNTKETTEISGVDEVKVVYQLDGEYPDLLKYMSQLQNSTRLVMIDKFGVASNVDDQTQAVVYTMEMKVLFQSK